MDKAMLQGMLACMLLILQIPAATALDSGAKKAVQAATFEFRAPATTVHSKDLVGSAFAIGPNKFVTTAHLFDKSIGSHFERPVLIDSNRVAYQVADILQFSEQQDYIVFSLERPPSVRPLPIRQSEQIESNVYFAGWRPEERVFIEHGTFSGITREKESDWLRFSGSLWRSVGGGPLLDDSGGVVGIVQGRARDGGANYGVPISVLRAEGPESAHIRAMEMLRSLMPMVSSIEPLKAEIPLPLPFDRFSQELQQLRLAYFDRQIGPLLDAARRNFVLTGDGAADICNLLNGKRCQCKASPGISGKLVVDDPSTSELIRQVDDGKDVFKKVAGAILVRIREGSDMGKRTHDLSTDPLLHLRVALKGQAGSDLPLDESLKAASQATAAQDRTYVDFHDRTWYVRAWPLAEEDFELISLARKLPDGYVVLTRTVPAALSYAAELKLKVVANLVY